MLLLRKLAVAESKLWKKINAEFIFAFNFAQNLTLLLLVFSKEAILFLIYLLADKATYAFKNQVLLILLFLQFIGWLTLLIMYVLVY